MAQLIKLKRTAVQGKIPNTTNLELGELAINTYDGRIFFEKDDGSPSIQEILTTNSTNSGSFNLIGAISASGFITASYFYGDGSNLTNVNASSIAFDDITGKPSLVSGSSQINVTQTQLYSSLATTGSNTFKKGQIILNDTSGQNNSLTVGGNSTGDRFIVTTDTTAGNGIIVSSKNNTQNADAPFIFSGSSFEFGGGNVSFLNNVTIDGTLTINSAAEVLIEENTLKLNDGIAFDSGGLEVSGVNATGSLLWDDATSTWIAGPLGSESTILLNGSGVISGSSQLDGQDVDLNIISGSTARISTNFLSEGNTYLGSAGNNSVIYPTGEFAGNIVPISTGIHSLGSSANPWDIIYVDQIISPFPIISSSQQIVIDQVSGASGVVSSSAQTIENLGGSGILSSSNENFTTFSSSVDSRLDFLETDTGSQDGRLTSLESFTSSLSTTEYTYSGSFSGSFVGDGSQLSGVTSYTDADTLAYINSQGVVSGSGQIVDVLTSLNSYTSSNDITISNLESTTSSFEDRLSQLETETGSISTAQGVQDDRLDNIETYTSSLKTAISVSGTNLTVLGNLDVQGTTTTVDSSTINISGSLLKLNYGGGAVDGGIEVTDATLSGLDTGSLIWDGTNNYWKGGVKGSEVKLLRAGGDGILSGSSQVTTSLPAGTISGSQQVIDSLPTGTISGSSQILNGSNILSGSADVNITVPERITHTGDSDTKIEFTDNKISVNAAGREGVHFDGSAVIVNNDSLSAVDFRVKTQLMSHALFVDGGENKIGINTATPATTFDVDGDVRAARVQVEDEIHHADDSDTKIAFSDNKIDIFAGATKKVSIEGTGVIINPDNQSAIDFRVKGNTLDGLIFADAGTERVGIRTDDPQAQLHVEGTVSASYFRGDGSYLTGITANAVSWDNITSKPSDIVSSSAQTITNLGGSSIVSGSSQLDGSTFGATSEIVASGSFSGSFVGDGSGLTGVTATGTVSGSDQLTSSLDLLYEPISSGTHTLVSSSAQVTSLLPTGTVSGSSQVLGGSGVHSGSSQVVSSLSNQTVDFGTGDITANSFSGDGSSLTGITVSQAATVADTFTNQTSVTVTHNFNTRNILVAVYDSSNNQIIPQNVNTTNLDQAVITFPNAVTGTVVVAKGGHIVNSTASSFGGNFASNTSLNGYTLSGSGNIDFVGDLTVNGNTTITGTLTLSNADDIRIEDNTLLLNWGKGNTDGGLEVSATTGQTGSLLWDESDGAWKGGVKGSESKFLLAGGDGIHSGSQQVIDIMNVEGIVSGGAQLAAVFDNYQYWTAIADSGANISVNGASSTNTLDFQGGNGISTEAISTGTRFIEITLDTGSNHFIEGAQAASSADVTGLQSYTSSLKQAIEVSGTNLTVLGDLTVQGTNTTLNTTELLIEDKLITLASGSTTSLQADGAGIEIAGASKSLIWDHTNSSFLFNAKVSSSVGFKGDGSELTDIAYSNIDFGGSGVVSGSDQVTSSLDLRYLEINGDNVLSGSDQVTGSLDLRYLEINGDNVLSGSDQVTSSLDLRYLEINGDNVLSSSNENFTDYSQSVDSRLDAVESYTGSLDINNAILTGSFTGSFVGDGSGLSGITVAQVASITASFSNQSTINVAHNFDSYNVITSVYDDSLSQIIPQTVSLTDKNTVQVVLSSAHSGHVVVAKGGHVISAQDSFRQTVSGNSSYTITHNLDESYPFVQAWNTGSGQMEIPSTVTTNSANQITVTFNSTFGGRIIVKK